VEEKENKSKYQEFEAYFLEKKFILTCAIISCLFLILNLVQVFFSGYFLSIVVSVVVFTIIILCLVCYSNFAPKKIPLSHIKSGLAQIKKHN